MRKEIKGIFAAGVTGGHIYPALAVAEELKDMISFDALFIGSGKGAEKNIYTSRFPFRHITVPARGSDHSKISYAFFNSLALLKSLFILKREKADFVFTTGGYVGGIVAYAAHLLRIPIFLHESNTEVGVSNTFTTRYSVVSFCTFKESADSLRNAFISGTPVRKEFYLEKDKDFKKKYGPKTVLVLGGSEGSEVMDHITEILAKRYKEHTFIHVGPTKVNEKNVLNFEYVENIAYFMRNANILVSRAGASTIAEMLAVRIPALLVPWSGSLNLHQFKNASALSNLNVAIVLDERTEKFEEKAVNSFEKVMKAAQNMHQKMEELFPTQRAAQIIAKKILERIATSS